MILPAAFPAMPLPFFLNGVFNVDGASRVVPGRGCWSFSTSIRVPFSNSTSTGTTMSFILPASIAGSSKCGPHGIHNYRIT